MDQIDARVALNRTNIKTHKEIADSGIYPTAYANDYGLEVINYTDDEVLKYEKAKDKAFKSYLNKLGEKESKVAQNLKKIEDYPEAIKKEILENEEVLLQEDADKLYGKITGEEPEPSAAVKQTDDILNNRHGDLTDEELINAIYDEREVRIKEGGLTSSEKTSVLNRYDRERPKALALNTNTEFNVASLSP